MADPARTSLSAAAHRADWAASAPAYALAWGLPLAAIAAGFLLEPPARAALWSAALAWMGIACLWNARRCGRTHCRYTGPFYLLLIAPVLALGSGFVSAGPYDWVALALLAAFGGKAIWWATERALGRYG